MKLYSALFALLTIFFISLLTSEVKAQYDSCYVLTMEDFNKDNAADYLLGKRYYRNQLLPSRIKWSNGSESVFVYPALKKLTGGCSFIDMNSDGQKDIVIFLSGYPAADSTLPRVSVALAVFAQMSLQLDTLDLSALTTYQVSPFVYMSLQSGVDITNPQLCGLNGDYSFDLKSVTTPELIKKNEDAENTPTKLPTYVRLYPNPASYYTNLELNNFPAGEYYIRLFNTDGAVLLTQLVKMSEAGKILEKVDLSSLFTGNYTLSIASDDKNFGSFRIIVVR